MAEGEKLPLAPATSLPAASLPTSLAPPSPSPAGSPRAGPSPEQLLAVLTGPPPPPSPTAPAAPPEGLSAYGRARWRKDRLIQLRQAAASLPDAQVDDILALGFPGKLDCCWCGGRGLVARRARAEDIPTVFGGKVPEGVKVDGIKLEGLCECVIRQRFALLHAERRRRGLPAWKPPEDQDEETPASSG